MNVDASFLHAALAGYQNRLAEIDRAMLDLRRQLRVAPQNGDAPAPKRRRKMSAAARRRIAAAQKKRWAAYKKAKAAK